jgi:hypothetical protein
LKITHRSRRWKNATGLTQLKTAGGNSITGGDDVYDVSHATGGTDFDDFSPAGDVTETKLHWTVVVGGVRKSGMGLGWIRARGIATLWNCFPRRFLPTGKFSRFNGTV